MRRALILVCLVVLGSSPVEAGQVWYTFELPDAGVAVSDRLPADGAQTPTLSGGHHPVVDATAANAAFGSQSVFFAEPTSGDKNTMEMNGVTALGSQFTLAAMVKMPALDSSRIMTFFSNYPGGSASVPGVLSLAIYSNGGVNIAANGIDMYSPSKKWPTAIYNPGYHHIAMTYNNGAVEVFLDGSSFYTNTTNPGAVTLNSSLHFGSHDPACTFADSQQFAGWADDVFLYNTVLRPSDIQVLATRGVAAFIPEPSTLALLAIGLVGLLAWPRKRKN